MIFGSTSKCIAYEFLYVLMSFVHFGLIECSGPVAVSAGAPPSKSATAAVSKDQSEEAQLPSSANRR